MGTRSARLLTRALFVVIAAKYVHAVTEQKFKLTFAGLVPADISASWATSGIIPAIEMAIDDINNRSDILADYQLTWDWKNDKCDPGVASYLLCEHVFKGPQKIMVLGGACSVATVPVASFSHRFNLIQMSYAAATPQLSDKSKYPLFFRTESSDVEENIGRIAILKHFGWTRAATLYQNEVYFVMVIDDMIAKMRDNDVDLIASLPFDYQSSEDLESLKAADARIIIVHSYEDYARALFCAAYKQGMYGSKYVWMLPGWYSYDWWKVQDSHSNCTIDEMRKVLESVIQISQDPIGPENVTNINGETFIEYEQRYYTLLETRPEYSWIVPYLWHGSGYDAVWAMALAMNTSIQEIALTKVNDTDGRMRDKRLDDFTYADADMAALFRRSLFNMSFQGTLGRVWFNEHGDKVGRQAIYQILEGDKVYIAVCTLDGELLLERDFEWQGGKPPVDGQRWTYTIISIETPLVVTATVLTFFGITLAAIFLVINVWYREHGFIKLSSPRMNNITLFGSMLVYLSIIPLGLINSPLHISVNTRTNSCVFGKWLLSVGFTLAFGPMFAKTWRVHSIFTSITPISKTAMQDSLLILFVCMLSAIDVVLLTSWQITDPCKVLLIDVYHNTADDDTKTLYQTYTCTSQYWWYWLGALYGIKGLLLLFGCFLAHETRNIKVEGLNDSRQIGFSVYNIMVSCLVGVALSLALENNPTLSFAFTSFPIFLCASITIAMMFIPKVYVVMKDPNGEKFHQQRTRQGLSVPTTMHDVNDTTHHVKSDSKDTVTTNI